MIREREAVVNHPPVLSKSNLLKPVVHTDNASIVRLLPLTGGSASGSSDGNGISGGSTGGSSDGVSDGNGSTGGQVAFPCSAQKLPLSSEFSWQSTGAPGF